jgi:hypothetical protein
MESVESGYNISIDNVRKLSHLNVAFENVIREVMMSQGRHFCPFKEKKCEQDNIVDSQNVNQQLKSKIRARESEVSCFIRNGSTQIESELVRQWLHELSNL